MEVIKSIEAARELCIKSYLLKNVIGFVPTMGALHEGHLSLIKKARCENDFLAVSIFVNPIQFCKGEDYYRYPSDHKKDSLLLEKEGVDLLFIPNADDMYKNHKTTISVEGLENKLCGIYRPGHFSGVSTIVLKLFNVIKPCLSYFGEKDFQQLQIIKKMSKDLNSGVNIIGCSTVRDKSGLALSSRNTYMSSDAYKRALSIPRSIELAKSLVKHGEKRGRVIEERALKLLEQNNLKVDYVSICNPATLDQDEFVKRHSRIFIAARIEKIRLIDNDILEDE